MTEQIQILQRRFENVSRDLKVLWTALKVFSLYLGGNGCWAPLVSFLITEKKKGHANGNE